METTRILLAVICFAGMGRSGLPGGSALGELAASRRAPRNDEVCLVMRIAKGEIGVREATGHNDGKRVEEYLRYVGLKKGDPYCAAWVSWVFGQAGFKEPRTGWSPGLFPASRVVEGEVAASRRAPRNDERESIAISGRERTAVSGVVDEVAASRRAPRNDERERTAMSGRERIAVSGMVEGEVAASRRAPRNDGRARTAMSGVVEGEVAASRSAPRNDGEVAASRRAPRNDERERTAISGEVAASRRAPRNDERERTVMSGVVEGEVAASRRAPRNDGKGLVFGIYFPALKRIGHCGLVERMQGDFCVTIEANTNSQGGRDGNGVFRRLRHRRTIAKFADWFNK